MTIDIPFINLLYNPWSIISIVQELCFSPLTMEILARSLHSVGYSISRTQGTIIYMYEDLFPELASGCNFTLRYCRTGFGDGDNLSAQSVV